MAPPCWCVD